MDLHNIDDVRTALMAALESDQHYRTGPAANGTPANWQAQKNLDAQNQLLLKHIIAIHGWPKRSLVGDMAENAAFLIAQHADTEFMQHVFTLRAALPPEELMSGSHALMEDRLRIYAGQPQKYGTQFRGSPEGIIRILPIEGIDIEKLLAGDRVQRAMMDARRKTAGLGPIMEDLVAFNIQTSAPQKPVNERG